MGDFRVYLQGELVRRCQANPRYSMRAFARSLQVEPSFLSKILNGKRSITHNSLQRLSKPLGLSPQEVREFTSTLPKSRKNALLTDCNVLTSDQFALLSEWYHFAILELTTIEGFQQNPSWIARALGISTSDAKNAIERLFRLGFLEEDSTGTWVNRSGNNTTVGTHFTPAAIQNFHKQVLKKAWQALEGISTEERDYSAITFAIPTRLIPRAKEKIRIFRREIAEFLQRPEKRDRVYTMSISLFPVSAKVSPDKT